MHAVKNWMIEYSSMNLKVVKDVAKEAHPSIKSVTTGEMLKIFEVNGAAIEASASESESPMSATLSALQSFAPSPHIPIKALELPWRASTRLAFPSGLIRANILAFAMMALKVSISFGFLDSRRKSNRCPVIASSKGVSSPYQGAMLSYIVPFLWTFLLISAWSWEDLTFMVILWMSYSLISLVCISNSCLIILAFLEFLLLKAHDSLNGT